MKVTHIIQEGKYVEDYADYSASDAAHDDYNDAFRDWLSDELDNNFVSVYDIIGEIGEDHPVSQSIDAALGGESSEDMYVHKGHVKAFMSTLKKDVKAALAKYADSREELHNDPDMHDAYQDGGSYDKADPYTVRGLRRSDFA